MKGIRTITAIAALGVLLAATGAGAAELQVMFAGTPHQALFDIDFDEDKGLAVGGAGFMLRSEDGGKTWKRRHLQNIQGAILGVDVGPKTTLVVGQGGLILYSKPEGGWKQVASPTESRLFDVAANSSGLAVAVGEFGQVLISKNAGRNWLVQSMPWSELNDQGLEPHLYVAHVTEAGVITLAGEFASIIRSEDGGQTWSRLNTGDATIFDLELLDDGTGYAVGQDGLFLTNLGPASFAAMETSTAEDGPEPAEAAAGGASSEQRDAAVQAGEDTDAAAAHAPAWRQVDLGSEANLLGVAADQSGRVYVSGMRQFWFSEDQGENWKAVEGPGLNRMWFQSVVRSDDGQFYAVGKRGTLGLLQQ